MCVKCMDESHLGTSSFSSSQASASAVPTPTAGSVGSVSRASGTSPTVSGVSVTATLTPATLTLASVTSVGATPLAPTVLCESPLCSACPHFVHYLIYDLMFFVLCGYCWSACLVSTSSYGLLFMLFVVLWFLLPGLYPSFKPSLLIIPGLMVSVLCESSCLCVCTHSPSSPV